MPHRVFDRVEIRCPKLGGPISFGDCRQATGKNRPCPRALSCFGATLPAEAYFRRVLEASTFREIFEAPPQGGYERLLGALDAAVARAPKPGSTTIGAPERAARPCEDPADPYARG